MTRKVMIRSLLVGIGTGLVLVGTAPAPARGTADTPAVLVSAPLPILWTTYQNNIPGAVTSNPNWARDVSGGRTWLDHSPPPRWEWTPIIDPHNEYEVKS